MMVSNSAVLCGIRYAQLLLAEWILEACCRSAQERE